MIFLGGTVKGYDWRSVLIPKLKVSYYRPKLSQWTREIQLKEIELRKTCDCLLYTITDFSSVYSMTELVDDSNKRPNNTTACILDKGWYISAKNKMRAIENNILKPNGIKIFYDLDLLAKYLNENCR